MVLADTSASSAELVVPCSCVAQPGSLQGAPAEPCLSWKGLQKTPSEVPCASGGTGHAGQPLSTRASARSASYFPVIIRSLGRYGCPRAIDAGGESVHELFVKIYTNKKWH